jgi:hypothetical protein
MMDANWSKLPDAFEEAWPLDEGAPLPVEADALF